MYMSKMTAAILDDLDYIVDPSEVSLDVVHVLDPRYARNGGLWWSLTKSTSRNSDIDFLSPPIFHKICIYSYIYSDYMFVSQQNNITPPIL